MKYLFEVVMQVSTLMTLNGFTIDVPVVRDRGPAIPGNAREWSP